MGTIIVSLIVLCAVALAIRSLVRDRKKGGCAGGCSGCSGCGAACDVSIRDSDEKKPLGNTD